jgi:hypothetical protein
VRRFSPINVRFSIVDKMPMGETYSFVRDFFSELELSIEVKLELGFIIW